MVEFNYPKKGVRMRVMCIREKEGFTLGRRDRYFRYYKIAKKKKGFEEKDWRGTKRKSFPHIVKKLNCILEWN